MIGYDPFNEPMPSWNGLLDLLKTIYPGNYDNEKLTPLYSQVFERYQKQDKGSIMFFEPGQFPDEIGFNIGKYNPNFVFNVGF